MCRRLENIQDRWYHPDPSQPSFSPVPPHVEVSESVPNDKRVSILTLVAVIFSTSVLFLLSSIGFGDVLRLGARLFDRLPFRRVGRPRRTIVMKEGINDWV